MRRLMTLAMVGALLLLAVGVAPVAAGSRTAVQIEVTTSFLDDEPDPFEATGIEGCATGFVTTGNAAFPGTRFFGLFLGYKIFDCGGDSGFLVRLNARFGPDGSVGSWSIVDAWGTVAGLQGAGQLEGVPIDEGVILDVYDGSVTL